ncbi:MAG: Na+/H+ antiporter NhaC family protein, partial [Anaerotignum sp.]
MKTKTRNTWLGMIFVVVLVATAMSMTVFGGEAEAVEYTSNMYATVWSLVPPLVAIILALITKEVYSSLFIGIVVGGLFYANFDIKLAYLTIFT